MNTKDWYEYLGYLRGEIKGKNLQNPPTIADAYNNFQIMQDLDDVLTKTVKRGKSVKAEA